MRYILVSVVLVFPLASGVFAQPTAPDCEAERCAAQSFIAQNCPSCADASNHGRYVSCVAHQVKAHVSPRCRGKAVRCAARSTCGKPGFVTCNIPTDTCDLSAGTPGHCVDNPNQMCSTDFDCGTRCHIKSSDVRCTEAGGQVGTATSCCAPCG